MQDGTVRHSLKRVSVVADPSPTHAAGKGLPDSRSDAESRASIGTSGRKPHVKMVYRYPECEKSEAIISVSNATAESHDAPRTAPLITRVIHSQRYLRIFWQAPRFPNVSVDSYEISVYDPEDPFRRFE